MQHINTGIKTIMVQSNQRDFFLKHQQHPKHVEIHKYGRLVKILHKIKYANRFVCSFVCEPTTCSTPCHPQLNQRDRGQMTVEAFRFGLASPLSPQQPNLELRGLRWDGRKRKPCMASKPDLRVTDKWLHHQCESWACCVHADALPSVTVICCSFAEWFDK